MEHLTEHIQKTLELMGFGDATVNIDHENRRVSIVVDDNLVRDQVASVLSALDHLFNLILHKEKSPSYVIDLNYYRRERERLIIELARATARKAMATKTEIELPPMNAYERRLVHVEIATHPELKTESSGDGKDRHVIIKHIS